MSFPLSSHISHQSLYISIAAAAHDLTIIMAVFSALKNKKNQKMREGIEDLVTKCSEAADKDDVNVQVKSTSEKKSWPYLR